MPRTKIQACIVEKDSTGFGFSLAKGAVFLHADFIILPVSALSLGANQTIRMVPCLWFEIDPDAEKEDRTFLAIDNRMEVKDFDVLTYLTTLNTQVPTPSGPPGNMTFHLYEVTPRKKDPNGMEPRVQTEAEDFTGSKG